MSACGGSYTGVEMDGAIQVTLWRKVIGGILGGRSKRKPGPSGVVGVACVVGGADSLYCSVILVSVKCMHFPFS